jgi:DNA/RNA-binding domain of Phe-tRNA-synthetase-like protein
VRIEIDDELKRLAPGASLGVLTATVEVTDHDEALWHEIDARVAELVRGFESTEIASIPEIAATRAAYKALGKDPSRYRGSAEALSRRIAQGKGLYRVNTVVDVNNLVSLETFYSIGLYDLRFVEPPVVFRRGGEGETYPGIAKGEINLDGLPVFADAKGPFGNPSSDSARTMIRADTNEVLMAIVSFSGEAGLDAALARAGALFERYARGRNVAIG